MTPASVSSYDLSRSIISHPPSSLAGRRPPSISSRSTTSRRHRSNRSHHGGSSSEPQNEFPNFAHTGDVEIIIHSDGQEKRYMLHRLILAQCSGFFDAGTSEEWSQAQAQSQGQISGQASGQGLARIGEDEEESQLGRAVLPGPPSGPKLRWRYELCDEGVEDDEMPMLVQKVVDATQTIILLLLTTYCSLRTPLFLAANGHPGLRRCGISLLLHLLAFSGPWRTCLPCSLPFIFLSSTPRLNLIMI